jgi:hypothetical protein
MYKSGYFSDIHFFADFIYFILVNESFMKTNNLLPKQLLSGLLLLVCLLPFAGYCQGNVFACI